MAFSPDTRFLATGNNKGEVGLFDIASGEKKSVLDTRGQFVLSVAFVRGRDGRDFPTSLWLARSLAHRWCPQSPNGKYLACGAIDGRVYVFDLQTGKLNPEVGET